MICSTKTLYKKYGRIIVTTKVISHSRCGHICVSDSGKNNTCPVLDFKFIALSHNTIRGAAGAAVLNAELIYKKGLLPG